MGEGRKERKWRREREKSEECKRRGMQIRNAWAESRRKRARVSWEDRERVALTGRGRGGYIRGGD